jgi:hypothetical protein
MHDLETPLALDDIQAQAAFQLLAIESLADPRLTGGGTEQE